MGGTWSIGMFAAFIIAAIVFHCQSAAAEDHCATQNATLKRLASGIHAEISSSDIKAEQTFTFRWNVSVRFPGSKPVYLVLAVPGDARFETQPEPAAKTTEAALTAVLPGVMAFPKGAKAPFGMQFGAGGARAVIPLYQPGSLLSGSVAVRIFKAGIYEVKVAVVVMGNCGEQVLSQDLGRMINVLPGTPEIVVQDPYDVSVPERTLISNSGSYLAQIFDGRYRVYDITTGAKLLDRAGYDPNFSPTSRFIVADIGDHDGNSLEVIDLVSREVIYTAGGPFVGWVDGDAFLVDGLSRYGGLSLRPSLISRARAKVSEQPAAGAPELVDVDRLSLSSPGSCHLCASWSHAKMMLDVDRGVVVFSDGLSADYSDTKTEVYELATGYKACCADARKAPALAFAMYGVRFDGRPGWHTSSPLAFSHIYDPLRDSSLEALQDQDWYKAAIPLRQLLVAHREGSGKVLVAELADMKADTAVRGDWRAAIRAPGETGGGLQQRLLAELIHFDVSTAPITERKIVHFANSPADQRYDQSDGSNSAKTEAAIRVRTAPYRKWLTGEVPALVPYLLPANQEPQSEGFPYEGDLSNAKIDLNNHLAGLWRWQAGGHGLWLMQLLTIEGSEAIGNGAILLLDGGQSGAASIVNLSKALPGLWNGGYGVTRRQTQLKPQLFNDRYLVIGSVVAKTIAVYDVKEGRMLTLVKDAPQADLMMDVVLSADARHVIQINSDGQFFLFDIITGARALSGRYVDGEIILYTPEGYYWSSYEGAHFVQLRFPGLPGLFPFLQFASVLNRPDLVKARLGATTAPGQSRSGLHTGAPVPALTPPPALDAKLLKPAASDPKDRVLIAAHSITGLARLRFYLDGELVRDRKIEGAEFRGEVDVPYAPQARFLTVLAADTAGFPVQATDATSAAWAEWHRSPLRRADRY